MRATMTLSLAVLLAGDAAFDELVVEAKIRRRPDAMRVDDYLGDDLGAIAYSVK